MLNQIPVFLSTQWLTIASFQANLQVRQFDISISQMIATKSARLSGRNYLMV